MPSQNLVVGAFALARAAADDDYHHPIHMRDYRYYGFKANGHYGGIILAVLVAIFGFHENVDWTLLLYMWTHARAE